MHPSLEDQDESVRIAVKALGDMRNGKDSRRSPSLQTTPALSIASSSTPPSPSIPSPIPSDAESQPHFVSRVSHFPIVNTAIKAYEQGKASSRVVKYGAEMVESSVKSISGPVMSRLPVDVNSIDQFACRQLDRLESYRRPNAAGSSEDDAVHTEQEDIPSTSHGDDPTELGARRVRGRPKSEVTGWIDSVPSPQPHPSHVDSRTPTPTLAYPDSSATAEDTETHTEDGGDSADAQQQQRQVAQRTRWEGVLAEVGGLSAALSLSEENMRRLKYCLQWLQYATAHIDAQILILRDFTAQLQPLPPTPSSAHPPSPHAPVSPAALQKLTTARRDVVHTVRQVVDVISKYAGGALPEPARATVRGFILKLPQRWASAAAVETAGSAASSTGSGVASGSGSRRMERRSERGVTSSSNSNVGGADSPTSGSTPSSPRSTRVALHHHREGSLGHLHHGHLALTAHGHPLGAGQVPTTAGAAVHAAQRVLALATESLDMMRGVTAVVKDSLERADTWVSRLRVVGLQRTTDADGTSAEAQAVLRDIDLGQLPPMQFGRRGSVQLDSMPGTPGASSEAGPSEWRFSTTTSTTRSGSSVPGTPYGGGSVGGGSIPGTPWEDRSVPGTPAPLADTPLASGIGGLSLDGKVQSVMSVGVRTVKEEEEMDVDGEVV